MPYIHYMVSIYVVLSMAYNCILYNCRLLYKVYKDYIASIDGVL